MGVSADAILFYGYCWGEEASLLPTEWREVVARKRGHANPWDGYEEPDGSLPYPRRRALTDGWIEDHASELDAWYAALRSIEAEFGVADHRHCSGDYPIPLVCVEASLERACQGKAVDVTGKSLAAVPPEWPALLDRWFAATGVAKPHDAPRWWLASYWN